MVCFFSFGPSVCSGCLGSIVLHGASSFEVKAARSLLGVKVTLSPAQIFSAAIFVWLFTSPLEMFIEGISAPVRGAIAMILLCLVGRSWHFNLPFVLVLGLAVLAATLALFPTGNYVYGWRFLSTVVFTIITYNYARKLSRQGLLQIYVWASLLVLVLTIAGLSYGDQVYTTSADDFGGSKAFIESTNQFSFLLVTLCFVHLYSAFNSNEALDSSGRSAHVIAALSITIAGAMVTTKVAIVGITLLWLIALFRRAYIIYAVLLFMPAFYLVIANSSNILDIIYKVSSLQRIILDASNGINILDAISSGRVSKINDYASDFDLWTLLFPRIDHFVNFEMEIFDALFHMGGIGVLLILYIIASAWKFFYPAGWLARAYVIIMVAAAVSSGHLTQAVLLTPFFGGVWALMMMRTRVHKSLDGKPSSHRSYG